MDIGRNPFAGTVSNMDLSDLVFYNSSLSDSLMQITMQSLNTAEPTNLAPRTYFSANASAIAVGKVLQADAAGIRLADTAGRSYFSANASAIAVGNVLQTGASSIRLADVAGNPYLFADERSMVLGGSNRFLEANGASLALGASGNTYFFADGNVLFLRSEGANVIEATAGWLRLGKQMGNQIIFTTNVLQLSNLVYANAASGQFWMGPAENDRVMDVDRHSFKIQGLRTYEGSKPNVIWATRDTLQIGDGATKAVFANTTRLQIGRDQFPIIYADKTLLRVADADGSNVIYATNDVLQVGANVLYASPAEFRLADTTGRRYFSANRLSYFYV